MNKKLFFAGLLVVAFIVSPTNTVFARTSATNYLPALTQWTSYGTTSVDSETARLTGGSQGWVYVDLDASEVGGSYLVVASNANKSDKRSSNLLKRSVSGNPYIYAYMMDSKKKIKKYQSGTLTTTSSQLDSDRVVYGIFPIESGTSTIRVFLMQSSVKNVSNYGANVTFTKPALLSTSSRSSAQTLVDDYAHGTLDLMRSSTIR
jgi:hypothetical protein